MKERLSNIKSGLSILLFAICCSFLFLATADAATKNVTVENVNYNTLTMQLKMNNSNSSNDAIYYSDSSMKTWTKLEGTGNSNGTVNMDISWVTITKDYTLNFKVNNDSDEKNPEVTSVTLPARNTKLKVKFNKATGLLMFTNENNVKNFEWRKMNSTDEWKKVPISQKASDSADGNVEKFLAVIESMRNKGGSIQVRTPQKQGAIENGSLVVGRRPSKEVKVSITKRANAPKIKINGVKLLVNTKDTMEYRIVKDSGNGNWEDAGKNMAISSVDATVLGSETAAGQNIVLEIRNKETSTKPYSKSFYLEIPGQRQAPASSEYTCTYGKKKNALTLNFPQASKSAEWTYEYYIDPTSSNILNYNKASWKKVKKTTDINIPYKKAPNGSTIYIRKSTIPQKASINQEFALASACAKLKVSIPAS